MRERAIARGMRPNRHPLDEDSASRLLQGLVHPDDAPPGYGPVAGLLSSAARLAPVDEDAAATTVSAMVEAVRGTTPNPQPHRRRSMIGRLFAGKALAAVATVALTATGAAAATGTLPTPVQGAVAGAVSHIGIDLPNTGTDDPATHHVSDDHGADNPAVTTTTTAATTGHDAGDDHGQGDVISGIAHDPALAGQPKGPVVCATASDGKCRAGEDHGDAEHGNGNSAPGSPNSGPGSSASAGHGNDDSADHDANDNHGADDPATHDVGDDHGGDEAGGTTTSTTVTVGSTPATTNDDHGGSHDGGSGSGSSGSGSSGKGKSAH